MGECEHKWKTPGSWDTMLAACGECGISWPEAVEELGLQLAAITKRLKEAEAFLRASRELNEYLAIWTEDGEELGSVSDYFAKYPDAKGGS